MPKTQFEGLPAADPLFSIETRREGDAMIVAVSGELDLAAADQLSEAIRRAEEATPEWTVIDLEDLSFMDSTVLAVLLEARNRATDDGNRLRFVRSRHDQVKRILSLTGTTRMFS